MFKTEEVGLAVRSILGSDNSIALTTGSMMMLEMKVNHQKANETKV